MRSGVASMTVALVVSKKLASGFSSLAGKIHIRISKINFNDLTFGRHPCFNDFQVLTRHFVGRYPVTSPRLRRPEPTKRSITHTVSKSIVLEFIFIK